MSALLSTFLAFSICSGGMYEGVPRVMPSRVRPSSLSSREVAMPKSTSLTSPWLDRRMLPGLMSRWITPLSWAYSRALQTSYRISMAASLDR